MNRKWSEQGFEPGWVVQLKFVDDEGLDTDYWQDDLKGMLDDAFDY